MLSKHLNLKQQIIFVQIWDKTCFVNSGNTMNESFQRTDTVFQIDQVNIVTKNILELDIKCR